MVKSYRSDREVITRLTEVPINEMHVTVKVETSPSFKFRMWLGRQLFLLLTKLWTAEYTLVFVGETKYKMYVGEEE